MIAGTKAYHCREELTTGHVHHGAVLPEILLALSNTPRPVPLQRTLFLLSKSTRFQQFCSFS